MNQVIEFSANDLSFFWDMAAKTNEAIRLIGIGIIILAISILISTIIYVYFNKKK